LGPCDVRGVMLHPVRVPPPTSRGSLPPWMFPRGIPSAALHTKQQVPFRRQIPRQPDSWLVITRILRPQHAPGQTGGGSRLPTVPLRSTAARLAATAPAKSSTPRIRHRAPSDSNSFFFSRQSFTPHHHRRTSHHASVPPKIPVSLRQEWRFDEGQRCRRSFPLALPSPGAMASSVVLVIPGASAFVPHLCSLVIPAGTLDPAPYDGKEQLSFALVSKLRPTPRRATC
jgi:hypothetical protein